jgi:hypothetical protein
VFSKDNKAMEIYYFHSVNATLKLERQSGEIYKVLDIARDGAIEHKIGETTTFNNFYVYKNTPEETTIIIREIFKNY